MNPTELGPLDRRTLLKAATASVAGAAGLCQLAETAAADDQPVPFIAAYTDQSSYQAGDKAGLCVSTSAAKYAIEIARVGATRQVVFRKDELPGATQPVPDDASSHGCRWPVACATPVSNEWRSGYYQVLLRTTEENGKTAQGEAFFVVRPKQPARDARILLQLATNTYNAYNNWGGTSLYGGPKGQGRRVSFDRPYAGFAPGDQFTSRYSGWRKWEQPFVAWAEEAGYQIDFAVNSDLEFRPEIVKPYKLVLSVGHDEYWSSPMRDSIEEFIADGGNVAFFSGNTCFWQVRSEDQGRALVSWKQDFHLDPVYNGTDHRLLSGMWSNKLVGRPENRLTGVSFAYAGYHRFFEHGGSGSYTIHRPDHWLFAGTGLKQGDQLGAKDQIVGYECDGCRFVLQDGLPVPTHADGTPEGFEILGTATAGLSSKHDQSLLWVSEALYGKGTARRVEPLGAAVLGCYTRGGTVVTTGCTEWVRGLTGHDPQVERITRNILDRLAG
ncbi:MAG TPA: N,N-dimethylformamidase beta subunit family domain-containing protein [Pirellulales bacterium]|nr:N,N-dimethylformamidase beta subunit family domain-containing protein [Pirellulales bacterium]